MSEDMLWWQSDAVAFIAGDS